MHDGATPRGIGRRLRDAIRTLATPHTDGAPHQTRVEFDEIVRQRTDELAAVTASLIEEVRNRRAAEAQNRALFARLVETQEEERRRIARDLHDHLGQQMTALRINLEVLADRCAHDDNLTAHVRRTLQLAEDVDRTADFLMWNLHPAALDHLGLAAALEKLVADWSERLAVPVEFDSGDTKSLRLPRDVESNLYRLAQEALHNVFKHAQASHVAVYLQRRDGHLQVVVEDDGCGFSVTEAADKADAGLGLVSMRERAALIGGTVDIESEPGRGTTVFARVPLLVVDDTRRS